MVTTDQIKELRDATNVSVMQCKKALEEAGGDMEKALIILRQKSKDIASKKADRIFGAGVIQSYVHGSSVGALVELVCETDFVAKNEEFKVLAHEIAMQVAATSPDYLKKEDIDEGATVKAREVFAEEVKDKPEAMREKILEGKLAAYFKDKVLLEQEYIKDPKITVNDLIQRAIQKFGEKIEVARFVRFSVLNK